MGKAAQLKREALENFARGGVERYGHMEVTQNILFNNGGSVESMKDRELEDFVDLIDRTDRKRGTTGEDD